MYALDFIGDERVTVDGSDSPLILLHDCFNTVDQLHRGWDGVPAARSPIARRLGCHLSVCPLPPSRTSSQEKLAQSPFVGLVDLEHCARVFPAEVGCTWKKQELSLEWSSG
jgi:hypothetical protein